MSEVVESRIGEEAEVEMLNLYINRLKEWLADLTFEEKQIWLWNAAVEILKIKQRREP
jgi:hypothetical protein